jgi:hypothetical protein
MKLPSDADENLGFDAAVAALGLKANVSEADHPLLCEGTRRQRYFYATICPTLFPQILCILRSIMQLFFFFNET